jgi:cell division protein ZipA
MLAKTRQLAEALGGEVRDARRSVLTRQAIGHIREQLNEWRHKAQVAQH